MTSLCVRIQRSAWYVHDMRQSTEWMNFTFSTFGNGMCTVGSAGSMQFVLCSLRLSGGPLPSLHGRARGVSPSPVRGQVCVDMSVIVSTLVQTRSGLWRVSRLQF